jgi:CheY-like chemotaxis protein
MSTSAGRTGGGKGPLVLFVDDAADNRALYSEYFAWSGFRVAEAANGPDGMALAQKLRPDVVVLDMVLPLMDGCEVIRTLKADPSTRPIPVIVLTGHSLGEDRVRAEDSGCDAFVLKPCLPADLVALVKSVYAARPR